MSFFSVLFIGVQVFAGISGNTFTDPKLKFSIDKPADWEFAKESKSFGIELKSGMSSAETGILVSFSKRMGEGFFGIKPSVGVTAPMIKPGVDLSAWLNDELNRQRAHDQYFVQVSGPILTTIETEHDAARIAFINSTTIDGQQVRVYHAVYLVRSGKRVILINMNCNENLANDYADTFAKIAGSIHFRP